MKWTTRLLFLLAISLSAAVIAMVSNQKSRTPEAALDAIEATIEREDFNHDAILRTLDVALANARSTGQEELQIRSLLLRGEVLFRIGASEGAIRDFDEVSGIRGQPDEELLLRMAEAHVQAGDPESGQRRIETLLSLNPENAKGHVQEGRLHQSSAKKLTDQCGELLDQTLPYKEAAAANSLVDRLTAQDLLDPRRAGQVSSLRALFTDADSERLARILVLCDDASLFNRKARESYEVSFTHGTEPTGVYEFITLLIRSGQHEHALRFGAQARKHKAVASHHLISLQLIRAHTAAGDGDGAGTMAAELIQKTRDLTSSEYADCCRALHLANRWSGLFYAANRMKSIGTAADGLEASLYLGLAQMGRKRHSNARNLLRTYASSNSPEPYPGAQYEAWTILAKLDRAAHDDFQERESVYAALQLDPNGTGASALWIRLAELQELSPHTSPLIPLTSYAEALCRNPADYALVLQKFEDLGVRAVAEEGRDLELIYQDTVREHRSLPLIPLGAYSLMEIARRHHRADNHLAVISVCRRILDNQANFTPAVDLMIEARLAIGRSRTATDQLVDRIDLIGLDETSKAFIRRLPPSPFTTGQLHRVMRADPGWTGRMEIARRYRSEGARKQALKTLNKAQVGHEPAEISLLKAEIQAELGERKGALENLSKIRPEDPDYSAALLLAAKVASITGDTATVDAATAALTDLGKVSALRALASQLMFDRRIQKASPVLDQLRSLSGESDIWTLERSILLHLVQGDVNSSREAAARAEAFSSSPSPPLGMVLASSLAGDTERLKAEADYLLQGLSVYTTREAKAWKDQTYGDVGEAVLALFAEDFDRVRALLENAEQAGVQTPEWAIVAAALGAFAETELETGISLEAIAQAEALINGSDEEPREPSEVLGVLLAAQTEYFAPYALEKLNQYAAGERNAWDTYLIAKTLDRGNETLRARDALWPWVQADSDYFAPSWELFEDIELKRIGHYDHSSFDELRVSKAFSKAKHAPNEITTNVARCYQALKTGKALLAARAAKSAHDLDPKGHETNAALAMALLESGDSAGSLSYWISACKDAPAAYQSRFITWALISMERSLQAEGTAVLPSVQAGGLQTLSSLAPNDPRIPLALARIDLQQQADNPALGVARAFRRLDNFLRTNDDEAIADLHANTEEDWIDFYLRYGPKQALSFCRSQLELSPGKSSLWLGEVRALRALGRHQDALEAAEQVLQMAPSAALYEEIASCLQASGAPTKQVEDNLMKAKQFEESLSVDAMLTRTKSLLAVRGERTADQAISVLSRVWDPKDKGAMSPTSSEVGLLLSEGFMKRGQKRDYGQAIHLLDKIHKRGQDPYDRSLARALSGLCAQATN